MRYLVRNDQMTTPAKNEILRRSCHFFSSERWWKPILTFLSAKCKHFQGDSSTNDENTAYREFVNLLERLVDETLCAQLEISPDTFETVMSELLAEGNAQAKLIGETLTNASDFESFRAQMKHHNARVDALVSESILELSTAPNALSDPDKFTAAVAERVREREDAELAKLLEKSCAQMRTVLNVATPQPAKAHPEASPDEVARRRQFWIRQREILADEEARRGRPSYRNIHS